MREMLPGKGQMQAVRQSRESKMRLPSARREEKDQGGPPRRSCAVMKVMRLNGED